MERYDIGVILSTILMLIELRLKDSFSFLLLIMFQRVPSLK